MRSARPPKNQLALRTNGIAFQGYETHAVSMLRKRQRDWANKGRTIVCAGVLILNGIVTLLRIVLDSRAVLSVVCVE